MTEDNIPNPTTVGFSAGPAAGTQSSALTNANTETETGSASSSRSRRRKNKKKSSGPNSTETRRVIKAPTVIFKGDCLKMNGQVFQCAHESNDPKQFSRTKEELMRWSQTNYKQEDSDELRQMLKHMKEAVFILPTDPTATASRTEERIWESQCSDYIKGQKRYKGQKGTLFATIWGQCSPAMQASLRSAKGYEEIEDQSDVIELLNEIRGIIYNFDSRTYVYESILKAKLAVFAIRQEPKETAADYLLRFKQTISVSEHYGASLFDDEILAKHELVTIGVMDDVKEDFPSEGMDGTVDHYTELARSKMQAFVFIQGAERRRYSSLFISLQNNHTKGTNQYPATLNDAFTLLTTWKTDAKKKAIGNDSGNDERNTPREAIQLFQAEEVEEEITLTQEGTYADKVRLTIICYMCLQPGHYVTECRFPQAKVFPPGVKPSTIPKEWHPRPDEVLPKGIHSPKGVKWKDVQTETGTVAKPVEPKSKERKERKTKERTAKATISKEQVLLLQAAVENEPLEDHAQHFTLTQLGMQFTQQKQMVNKYWVLLDNESTCNIFNNADLLCNIRPCESGNELHIKSNGGGSLVANMIGDLLGFGPVHYHPSSVANILSFSEVAKVRRISIDTDVENAFTVHGPKGTQTKFIRSDHGLYYHDTRKPKAPVTDYSLVNTVADNKSNFTRKQLTRAETARHLYVLVGRPSHRDFITFIRNNTLKNCPVTTDDANRALYIYGPDVAALRGKTKRRQPKPADALPIVQVPRNILKAHPHIDICADIFFVNQNQFFHTISKVIKLRTVASIAGKSVPLATLYEHLIRVARIYDARGFKVRTIFTDGQFVGLREPLLPLNLNVTAANEHVPEIERSIQTVKQRNRSSIHGLPFKRYPRALLIAIVEFNIRWLNSFPAHDSASDYLSPRTIVLGKSPDFNTDCLLELGTYCEIDEANNPTNTPSARTRGAISLNPTGNVQGSYDFMTLNTGQVVSRHHWTPLPMTEDVIASVEARALRQRQPLIRNHDFLYHWRRNIPFIPPATVEDDSSIESNNSSDEGADDHDNDDDDDEATNVDEGAADTVPETDSVDAASIRDDANDDDSDDDDDVPALRRRHYDSDSSDDDDSDYEDVTEDEQEEDDLFWSDWSDDDDDDEDNEDDDNEEALNQTATTNDSADPAEATSPSPRSPEIAALVEHNYSLRDRSNISNRSSFEREHYQYMQQHADVPPHQPSELDEFRNIVSHAVLTQMSAKKGIKKHGQVAIEAIISEFQQLDDKRVLEPKLAANIDPQEKRKALRAITLIKEKRTGKIKGRTVADGRSQRDYISSEDSSSPTVSIEALYISLAIDANEGRDVATCDVEGAYLHADMKDLVYMKLEGVMVDFLVQANPERYKDFVTTENGKKVLYVQLLKALYGCIQSALLWWELFSDTLINLGFELNPYDSCVANKIVNGKQLTICWYVDDLKISHVDPKVVSEIIKAIEDKFGKMTVTRGKKHSYVGLEIEIVGKEVKICTKAHITESFEMFGEDVSTPAVTPAKCHLFDVAEDPVFLPEKKRVVFHSVTAKLLFVGKRGRPDIQTTVSFLTTRVSKADQDDWGKLKRLLQYLNSTIDLLLTLSMDSMHIMKTWVDASYAVHPDMRSHTGGCISFGKGMIISKSLKQKLNTKSSTEAELVGATDILPANLWTKYFIEAQGYNLTENDFYQDNESAMKMERNGRSSAGQGSRHIHIRFFWIRDRIAQEGINLLHCPTYKMVADYFTKPLQGEMFRIFRDVILGIKHYSVLENITKGSPPKERVET